MLITVTDIEFGILQACFDLQFGTFFPRERKLVDGTHNLNATPEQFKLVEHTRKWGLPLEVTVTNGQPVWAKFEIKLGAGIGHKRIKLD
jgi:hypothetical protein